MGSFPGNSDSVVASDANPSALQRGYSGTLSGRARNLQVCFGFASQSLTVLAVRAG